MTADSRAIAASVEGRRIYAIGDVHGRFDLLTDLLARIRADADGAEPSATSLIFVGDYIDRGPDSARVISTLVWLRRNAPFDVTLLKGNHEEMLLDFCDDPIAAGGWLEMGGAEMLASYGVDPLRADAPARALRSARDRLLDIMPAAHLDLLRTLPLSLTIGDVLFVHAGVRPGVPLDLQRAEDMLWIRDAFLDDDSDHGKLIVHGHSWLDDRPVVTPTRVGIDTGAYATGVLTAARIEDGALGFLQAHEGLSTVAA